MAEGKSVEPFDPTRPNIARVWDYWLGGKDNFAVDRELAQKMLQVHPLSAQMARENRRFLGRAVSYVAACGVRQFIDVGAGLPTAVNTHDIAQEVAPGVRVAYVDNDPVVISHARSLLAKSPGVIAVPGDMRDPERIFADAGDGTDQLGFKGSSQHCLVGPSIGTHRAPRPGSSSRGSCGGGR